MPDAIPTLPPVPESRAVPRKRTRLSLVWIVPIVAAARRRLGGGHEDPHRGADRSRSSSRSAEGLEAGKTKIHYNGVDVGTMTTIRLSDDHQQRDHHRADGAQDGELPGRRTRSFWVVRPRISGANVTGLGTLISGAYIGMEIGESKRERARVRGARDAAGGDRRRRPVASSCSRPRTWARSTPARRSSSGGCRSVRSRRTQLDKDGQSLSVKVFVNAPYDQYVTREHALLAGERHRRVA